MDMQFEYLDHPADIIIHGWGKNFEESLENTIYGMFDYMTPLECVELNPDLDRKISFAGHDLDSLVFSILDELLYIFCTEYFIFKKPLLKNFDSSNFKCDFHGSGELFDLKKHKQGTEIKAITMHNLKILQKSDHDWHIYVTVDI